jgi:hypothetical protein
MGGRNRGFSVGLIGVFQPQKNPTFLASGGRWVSRRVKIQAHRQVERGKPDGVSVGFFAGVFRVFLAGHGLGLRRLRHRERVRVKRQTITHVVTQKSHHRTNAITGHNSG